MADNLDINTIHEELAKKNFIVFAGTGVVHGTGVPDSWTKLLEDLGSEAGIDVKEKLKKEEDYPDIAETIYQKFKEQKKEEIYHELIRKKLRPTVLDYAPLAKEIISATKWVVTTNFDLTIEKAFEKDKCKPKILILPEFEKKFEKPTLVYLHGNTTTGDLIFRKGEYDLYYPSVSGLNTPRKLEEYLEYIYDQPYTIVFIGCSFKDRYLRSCLEMIHERLVLLEEQLSRRPNHIRQSHPGPHYAFLRKPRRENYKEEDSYKAALVFYEELEKNFDSINIKVVWINEFIEWVNCFRKICQEIELRKPISGKVKWTINFTSEPPRSMNLLKDILRRIWRRLKNSLLIKD